MLLLLTFCRSPFTAATKSRAALARGAGADGDGFDALLRCYLKLLLLLHQVSCCLLLHAFIATPAQAPFHC